MKKLFAQVLLIFVLILTSAVLLWWSWQRLTADDTEGPSPEPAEAPASPAPLPSPPAPQPEPDLNLEAEPEVPQAAPEVEPEADAVAVLLLDWEEELLASADPGEALEVLRALQDELGELPPEAARALLLRILESGTDIETGLPFAVASDGFLNAYPSLRLFALDALGRLDPQLARDVAEVALSGPKTSAEEYALHLRNILKTADGDPAAREQFSLHLEELLTHEPWLANPSDGFAEAHDLIVHMGLSELTPLLVDNLALAEAEAIRKPAFLALDRMAHNDPAAVLPQVAQDWSALDAEPYARAGLVARADLSDSAQSALAEDYLLQGAAGVEEQTYFFEMLPNLNQTIGPGLAGNPASTRPVETVEALKQTRAQLDRWKQDPRLLHLRAPIEAAADRVADHLDALAQPEAQAPPSEPPPEVPQDVAPEVESDPEAMLDDDAF